MTLVRFDPSFYHSYGFLLLVKLSVVQSFYRCQFFLSPSISRLCSAGDHCLRFTDVYSKLVN